MPSQTAAVASRASPMIPNAAGITAHAGGSGAGASRVRACGRGAPRTTTPFRRSLVAEATRANRALSVGSQAATVASVARAEDALQLVGPRHLELVIAAILRSL